MADQPQRLHSLDILRGADLFLLVVLCPLLLRIPCDAEWFLALKTQFTHTVWEGFTLWDLVMPLFMFMSGVTVPFALARYRAGGKASDDRRGLYLRLAKRFALLWLLGMVVQGNLLTLDPGVIKPVSNTLQAIAVGYVASALLFVHTSLRTQYIVAVGLLLGYWGLMSWGGDFTTTGNFAEAVDRAVLGAWRDGAYYNTAGEVVYESWYHYTWVVTSLTFVATVLSGSLAGHFLKSSSCTGNQTALRLIVAGIVLAAAGWLWGIWMPVIKPIWTSSMVLVSSGYCLALLGGVYWAVDVQGWSRKADWLRIYGMNSIVAYVLSETQLFWGLSERLLGGLGQHVGAYNGFVIELGSVALVFALLLALYRCGKFLRV